MTISSGKRLWTEHAALAGWTLLAILYRGFGFGVGDQNLYLPFVLKWANPQLFPNDYLLSLGYARESVTWVAMSWAARLVDIRFVAGAAYVLTSYLTLWAILRLAQAWWDDRLAGWIAVLIWSFVYLLPGNDMYTVDPYFTGRGLAYPLCFLALLFLLRDKAVWVALCLFAAALVHSVSILPVVGAAALYYLSRKRWRDFAVLSGVMAGAALILLAMASAGGSHDLWARYDPEWAAMAARGAKSLFPTEWGGQVWAKLLLYASLCMAVLLLGRVRKGAVPWPALSGCLFASSLLLWVLSLAGTWAQIALLVQLSLMRSCLFMILLLGLALAGWCAKLVRGGSRAETLAAALALGCWVTDQALLQALAVVIVLIAVAGPPEIASSRLTRMREVITPRAGVLALLALAAALYAMDFYAGRTLPWSPGPGAFEQAALVTGVLSLGWLALPLRRARWAGLLMASAFGLALIVHPATFAVQSLGQVRPFSILYRLPMGHAFGVRMVPDRQIRRRLAEAVRTSVPIGSTVIVPTAWDSFRVMTQRSSFVTQADMTPSEFSRSYAMEWRSRMEALYGEGSSLTEGGTAGEIPLGEGPLVEMARRYARLHIGYIITTRRYTFPRVAEVGAWTIYRIEPAAGEEVPPKG